MKYQNKKTGDVSIITNNNKVKAIQDDDELTKKLLVTLQSNDIAPDLNK